MSTIVPATFTHWSEAELQAMPPKELRLNEAFYFYEQFRLACGQRALRLPTAPREEQFHWITYADAFLAMLVSIDQLVESSKSAQLHRENLYHFVTQLRNITIHKTVLGARKHKHGNAPLVSRIYYASVGTAAPSYVDPKINFNRIRKLLQSIKNSRRHTGHVQASRQFLRDRTRQGNDFVTLRELFEESLELVGRVCGIQMKVP